MSVDTPLDTSELKSAQYENWEYPSSREGSAEGATFQMEEKDFQED